MSSAAALLTSMVQRAGFMQRFYSPYLAEYPAELKDSKGFWGTTNVYFMTLGYNTRNVKANELPKTYEDLLPSALERTDDVVDQPRFRRTPVHRQHSSYNGTGSREGLPAKAQGSKYCQKHRQRKTDSRPGDCGRISVGGADLQSSCLYQQSSWSTGGVAAAGTGHGDDQHDRLGEEFAAAARGYVVSRLSVLEKGQKIVQVSNYLPAHPEIPALQADLKPGGGRFKKANYINPDVLYDQGNEWVNYFENQFLK